MANNISGINPTGTPTAMDAYKAGEQAISFNEQLPNLAQKLRDALTSKFNESPLFAQRQTAEQGFLNQPSQTRADLSQMQQTSGVPLSPSQQAAIMQSRKSAAYVPLAANTLRMGSAYGGLEDIIGGGVRAFEAAGKAQSERANLMQEMYKTELERQFKQQQMDISLAKLAIQKSGGNLSASERLQGKTTLAALKQLTTFKNKYSNFNNTGPLSGFLTNTFKNLLPKSPLVDPYLASMQSDIGPMRDSILNAISGANVSAQEADRVKSWIPSNTKSPEENQRNLFSLEAWLNDKYSSLINPLSSSSDENDYSLMEY